MKGLKAFNVLWLILLLILSNCSPPVLKNPAPLDQPSPQASGLIETEYRIQVGDQLDVKFYYNPELNEQVIVRPDGRISLQLIHEVSAAGLTPDELTPASYETVCRPTQQTRTYRHRSCLWWPQGLRGRRGRKARHVASRGDHERSSGDLSGGRDEGICPSH